MTQADLSAVPEGLPEPVDDGAADHLPGMVVPTLTLPASDGSMVALDQLGPGRSVLYLYPMTGRPGQPLPDGWDDIPGARGCTPESCGFRDHHEELRRAGVDSVFGLSSQETDYQREMVARLRLPFPVLSDPELSLAAALRLPTFEAAGMRLYTRLTLVLRGGRVEHAFYPVFPPGEHAAQVLRWLAAEGR